MRVFVIGCDDLARVMRHLGKLRGPCVPRSMSALAISEGS
jgi:hypothetical protein